MGILSKWVESLDYEYEILTSCTRYRSPRSTCTKCIASCNQQAISFDHSKPVLDNEKCVECGHCIAACPEQAVTGIFPKRTFFQNQLVITDHSIASVKELLVYYQKGIRGIICQDPSLIEVWKHPINEANKKLELLGEEPYLVHFKSVESKEELYSRRELFSLWKKEGKSVLKQVTPAKWRFNQKNFDLTQYFRDFQFTSISLDTEKCTLCKACQNLCNKHCFEIGKEDFSISPQSCSGCHLCADICPEKAIVVEEQISEKEETKLPILEKICKSCKKTFHTLREHDEKCVACIRYENFFL